MGLQTKLYFNHTLSLLIFIFISTNVYCQDKLIYGTTNIATKQIEIDKYNCKITPSFSINEENPENLKLNFAVNWIDKKGNQVPQPDKISIFIKVNNNIQEYCTSNGKKLSTSPGLFGKKNIELTNSLSFEPAGIINISQYNNIQFKDKMKPISLKVLNFSSSPISMNLELYIGKDKGNSLEIDDKGGLLNWKIILPEMKQDEDISCTELENKYSQVFQENKPRSTLSYFETKLIQFESIDEPPMEKLWELNSELTQYKSDVKSLMALKESIKNDPNYKKCDQLPQLLTSISSSTADISIIQGLIDKVNRLIQNNSGGSGAGGGELAYGDFEANNVFCENTFNQLYNIKMDPDLLNAYEPNYLIELYAKLNNLKASQDSLYNIIISTDESPTYKRAYKNFKVNQSESIAIIETLDPNVLNSEETLMNEASPLVSSGRSFPYKWIIIPVLLILAAFGGFKLFKYIKKGKSINEKTK